MSKQILNATEAAKVIGCNPQKVRERLKRGMWKFGKAYPPDKDCEVWRYEIPRAKLYSFLGITGEEV